MDGQHLFGCDNLWNVSGGVRSRLLVVRVSLVTVTLIRIAVSGSGRGSALLAALALLLVLGLLAGAAVAVGAGGLLILLLFLRVTGALAGARFACAGALLLWNRGLAGTGVLIQGARRGIQALALLMGAGALFQEVRVDLKSLKGRKWKNDSSCYSVFYISLTPDWL